MPADDRISLTRRGHNLIVAVGSVLAIGATDEQVWDTIRRSLGKPDMTADDCLVALTLVYAAAVANNGQGGTEEQIKDEIRALGLEGDLVHGKPAEVDS